MNYYMACIVYTYKCVAECKMCGFSCSPDREEKMDVETAKSIIKQAKELDYGLIGFVGGEPMLFREEIYELLNECKRLNIASTISTNCYWANTEEEAEKILEELMSCGIHHIKISTDDFHSKFVPYENIGNVIRAARKIRDCKVVLACTSLKGSGRLKGMLEHLEDDTLEMNLMEQICYPVGRAKEQFSTDEFIYPPYSDFCTGQGVLTIAPNGEVYPCASMCGITEGRKIGSIHEDCLEDLVEKACNDKHNRFIEKFGIMPYIKEIRAGKLPVDIPELMIDACHGCYELFGNKDNLRHLDAIVDGYQKE